MSTKQISQKLFDCLPKGRREESASKMAQFVELKDQNRPRGLMLANDDDVCIYVYGRPSLYCIFRYSARLIMSLNIIAWIYMSHKFLFSIAAYLFSARTVEPIKQLLLANVSVTTYISRQQPRNRQRNDVRC
jgi:hypothetical protein